MSSDGHGGAASCAWQDCSRARVHLAMGDDPILDGVTVPAVTPEQVTPAVPPAWMAPRMPRCASAVTEVQRRRRRRSDADRGTRNVGLIDRRADTRATQQGNRRAGHGAGCHHAAVDDRKRRNLAVPSAAYGSDAEDAAVDFMNDIANEIAPIAARPSSAAGDGDRTQNINRRVNRDA